MLTMGRGVCDSNYIIMRCLINPLSIIYLCTVSLAAEHNTVVGGWLGLSVLHYSSN